MQVAGTAATVASGQIINTAQVELTLSAAATTGQSVSVAYTKSATSSQNIKDVVGDAVLSFSAFTALNGVGVAPTLVSAIVHDAAPTVLSLVFTQAITAPATLIHGDFTVTVAGSPVAVSAAAKNAGVVDLTLASSVPAAAAVTFVYVLNGNAPDNIADAGPNVVAAITSTAATNNVGNPLSAGTLVIDGLTNGVGYTVQMCVPSTTHACPPPHTCLCATPRALPRRSRARVTRP